MGELVLPAGVTLVEPTAPPRGPWCPQCARFIDLARSRWVSAVTDVGVAEGGELVPLGMHLSCWEGARPTVVDGVVTGWRCHCCTCPEDSPPYGHRMTCRTVAPHAQDGCDVHRQPARGCDCGCES